MLLSIFFRVEEGISCNLLDETQSALLRSTTTKVSTNVSAFHVSQGMCVKSGERLARIQFSSFALSLDIAAFSISRFAFDVELVHRKMKKISEATHNQTRTQQRNVSLCWGKLFSAALHITELKAIFLRIHRNRISTIFFSFCFQICVRSSSSRAQRAVKTDTKGGANQNM